MSSQIAGAAVDRFFERVLADPGLAPRFDGAQLHRLAAQQLAFVAHTLGSPLHPDAPPITAGPGTEAALADHLGGALREVGAPEAAIAAVTRAALNPATAPAAYPPPVAAAPRRPAPWGSGPSAA